MTSSIASCRCPFVASTCPPRDVNGAPSMFVTRPPASATISAPPAMSHGFRSRFPEPVHAAGRDVAQVDRRRPEAPHRARLADEGAEQADDLVDARVHVVRKAGDEHRVDERRGRRHAQRPAVQKRAAAALGGEQLLRVRIENRGDLRDAVDLERQRRAEDRQAVRVVRGAVDRIEHPARARRATSRAAHLLGEHLMIGKALGDRARGTSARRRRRPRSRDRSCPSCRSGSRRRTAPSADRRRGRPPRWLWSETAGCASLRRVPNRRRAARA